MDNIDNFKAELHDLLKKYNASISCIVDGDTHGLTYEMIVDFSPSDTWYKLSDSNEIDWNNV